MMLNSGAFRKKMQRLEVIQGGVDFTCSKRSQPRLCLAVRSTHRGVRRHGGRSLQGTWNPAPGPIVSC